LRKPTAALVLAALVVAGACGWFWASPYFAVAGVHNAAVRGDTAAMNARVDFAKVREDFKAQYSRVIAEEMAGSLLRALGAAIAARVIDVAIDVMVTPAGIATLVELQQDGPRKEVSGFHLMFAKRYTVRREGLTSFEFHSIADQGKKPTLRFERQGLRWRLVALQVPKEYLLDRIRRR